MPQSDRDTPGEDPTAEERAAGHPVAEWLDGQPVPDLNAIAEERWPEVLGPLTHRVRTRAAYIVRHPEPSRRASLLVTTLELEEAGDRHEAERRASRPSRLPSPELPREPSRPSSRQVGFRISTTQHERLAEAARRVGAKPGQLARMLTLRGVEHMLWEERSRGGG